MLSVNRVCWQMVVICLHLHFTKNPISGAGADLLLLRENHVLSVLFRDNMLLSMQWQHCLQEGFKKPQWVQYLGYWCGCSWVSERSWPAGCVAALSAAVGGAPRPAAPSSSPVAHRPPVCPSAAPELLPEPPLLPELLPPAQQPQSDLPRALLANGLGQSPAAPGLPPLLTEYQREGENEGTEVKQHYSNH